MQKGAVLLLTIQIQLVLSILFLFHKLRIRHDNRYIHMFLICIMLDSRALVIIGIEMMYNFWNTRSHKKVSFFGHSMLELGFVVTSFVVIRNLAETGFEEIELFLLRHGFAAF